MRSGCDVAKDASDLVLLKNDFAQIRTSIMWGRLLNKNMQKFLAFQLTVNIAICFVTILGCVYGHPPLNVIQMLWVNLIMDILAAIALGTDAWKDKLDDTSMNNTGSQIDEINSIEDPEARRQAIQAMKDTDENLSMRIGRTDPLLRPFIWQQIIVQASFQILVMTILMFFGGFMLGFDQAPNIVYDKLRDPKGNATNRLVMDTFIFHVFVLMNLFNSINCRVLSLSELNMFSTFIDNWIFLAVLVVEFFVQQCMINAGSMTLSIPSAVLGTAELSTT